MKLLSLGVRLRIVSMYVLVGVLGFGVVVAFAAGLKDGTAHPHHTQVHHSRLCVTVGCAKPGDDVTYTIHGRVIAIDDSQPGARCVQVASRDTAGAYCARR